MAVRYTQIAELLAIMIRHLGRDGYEAVLKDLKMSQAYRKNQSFRETIERMERQLRTGRAKPLKPQGDEPAKRSPAPGRPIGRR